MSNNGVEISAHSVEEALAIALRELNLAEDEVKMEILEEPSKGFWGILGHKMARIKVTPQLDPLAVAKEFLVTVTQLMGLEVEMEVCTDSEYLKINFLGKKLGVLIGRRGDTLDALQYLTNLVVNKCRHSSGGERERIKIILDVEDYRQRRAETLQKLAYKMAEKVRQTGRKVVFEPMNPQERRIIHTTLQEQEGIETVSEGVEPFRRVVIKKA